MVRWSIYLMGCLMVLVVALPVANAKQVGIAAVVNDTIITTTDLRERMEILRAFSNAPNTPEARLAMTRQALRALMNEALQNEEAKRLSIDVKPEEIDAAVARIEQDEDLYINCSLVL